MQQNMGDIHWLLTLHMARLALRNAVEDWECPTYFSVLELAVPEHTAVC